ncbi:MAG: histidinol dehydrogenase [Rhodospirillales bacterium]|nr:histidinol dehydrogenase [Rhodospirillales bacterium]
MPLRLDVKNPDFERDFSAFLATKRELAADVDRDVTAILKDVRERGDVALIALTERFDGVRLEPSKIKVTDKEIEIAVQACDASVLDALRTAADRIGAYHRQQVPSDLDTVDAAGIRLGYRWTPLAAVGIYVPGGTAAYPSSVLMNAVPAKIAGVDRIAMTVPAPKGQLNPTVLAAARVAGVTEIYRVGGAQAIGALAFGTYTIPAVDKIVGPGNAYVSTAKRLVFGQVGIDTVAGPSEVVVVADQACDPRWIACDLLAQAEHDPAAQSILITDAARLAEAVVVAVDEELKTLPRAAIASASWRDFGAVILVRKLDDALPLIDRLAPEHLQLAVADPDALARRVRNAGAIFLGHWAAEALGDYVAGPNHVLPTARSARFASGLGTLDFLKRTSIIGCDRAGLAKLGPTAVRLATAEGLHAHARSITVRLDAGDPTGRKTT